jgi:hypothetical protein
VRDRGAIQASPMHSALAIYRGAAAAQISTPCARQTGVLHRAIRGSDFVVD